MKIHKIVCKEVARGMYVSVTCSWEGFGMLDFAGEGETFAEAYLAAIQLAESYHEHALSV